MIIILHRIKTSYKGEDVIIEKGEYKKVPLELRADPDFLHYVMSKDLKGKPTHIKGYIPTKNETEKYKPLVKSASKGEARIVKPDVEVEKETKAKVPPGKNQA